MSARYGETVFEPFAALLLLNSEVVEAPEYLAEAVCSDAADDKVLRCAAAGGVPVIVSGDRQPARIPTVRDEPIHLVPYDRAWPRLFEEERARLASVLGRWLVGPIEHVGSTAVPGLTAKPVIDIMVAVRDLPSSLDARTALAQLDYMYFPYRADVMHWFCKPSPAQRTHHLHLVPLQSPLWSDRLIFRDYLRSSPDAAAEYAVLKAALAVQHQFDREAYTNAKGDFVRVILERAKCGSGAATVERLSNKSVKQSRG